MTEAPLVSIQCAVYNQEPYLRQCLDGFVMQKTNFPFEAIVHDDASTDGSAAIIREYAEKYPDIIKPVYETENQYSKRDGTLARIMDEAMHPDSKYIAYCEGDDYWIDPNKLQMQVDFLESRPDYFMTCHAFKFYYEDIKEFRPHQFVSNVQFEEFNGHKYCTPSIDRFFYLPEWFTQILTIVRRKTEYLDPDILKKYTRPYDYITCYYMMKAGKCALFEEVMGIYRKLDQGVFSGRDNTKWDEEVLLNYYRLYQIEHEKHVLPLVDSLFTKLLIHNLRNKNFKKVLSQLFMHSKNVSFISAFKCLASIIRNHFLKR